MSFLLLSAALAIPSLTAGGLKCPNCKPAIATFRDQPPPAPGGTPAPDRIGSDGHGTYVDGVDGVKAIIDGIGDFDLDTDVGGQPIRKLYLDFGAPAPASAPSDPPFPTTLLVDAYFATKGRGLPDMVVGSSKLMGLGVNFPGWFIRFDPTQYPDTSSVLLTRTGDDTWEIEAAPTNIGKLVQVNTVRGKTVLTDHGNFFLPFKVTVKLKWREVQSTLGVIRE